ncbi:MAG: heme peroxidase family protein [Thiobacillus sp.]
MSHISLNKKLLAHALAAIGSATMVLASVPAYADNLHLPARFQPGSATTSFTRMFPLLPPFVFPTDEARERAQRLGALGGPLDALDNLTDPIQSIINQPVFSPNNLDNPNMTAGVTFLGQFLDHDVTLDPRSKLLEPTLPHLTTNFRTPAYDLDSLYGGGPENSPELYDASTGDYLFRIEAIPGSEAVSRGGATRYDLPRDAAGNAIVAESRNDENTIISQLHLAMLRFHNNVVRDLRANPANAGLTAAQLFNKARQTVRWHYQWIIVHEFLPLTIGQSRVDQLIGSVRATSTPKIPIEFSVAAYRFGHSQVRPSYRLNFGPTGGSPFFAFVFDDSIDPSDADPVDLRGGKRAPRRFVDWQTFFNFGDGNFRPNKRIDSKISSVLMLMPGSRAPAPGLPSDGVQSLASRNLMRHVNFGIASGQAIAKRLGAPVLTPSQLSELAPYGMDRSSPLWYYVLKEAEVMESGLRMGPVGSHIVGTVFIQLLKSDTSAYLRAAPNWTPTLPSATAGDFRMTDLLKFAEVTPPL